MDYKLQAQIVKIITDHILTPVIYIDKHENEIDFICFCDMNINLDIICETEEKLTWILNKRAVIADIREYCEAERIEIINEAEIIYSENQVIERLLAFCVADEFHKFTVQKDEAVRRYHDCGTAYIQ